MSDKAVLEIRLSDTVVEDMEGVLKVVDKTVEVLYSITTSIFMEWFTVAVQIIINSQYIKKLSTSWPLQIVSIYYGSIGSLPLGQLILYYVCCIF